MHPRPEYEPRFPGSGRLDGKVATDHRRRQRHRPRGGGAVRARGGRRRDRLPARSTRTPRRRPGRCASEGQECLTIAGDIGDEAFCRGAVEQTLRAVRPARRAGQQRRRAARAGIDRGHQPAAAGAHLRDQRVRLFLHDQGGAAAPEGGLGDRQHDLGHRLQGQRRSSSTTPRPGVRSSPSRARWRSSWSRSRSASTAWRRARSGRP